MVTIFCSHSSNDISMVASLKEMIEAMGHSMYLFEDDQRPGEYVAHKLQEEMRNADAMIVFLTRNSEGSVYVQQEIGYASGVNKPVIPLVELGVPHSALGMLEGREYIRFDRSDNPEEITLGLCSSLLSYLNKLDMDKMVRTIVMSLMIAALCIGIVYLLSRE